MIYFFCDTCVFLNIATEVKLFDLSQKLSELCEKGVIKLVVPDIIHKELDDHKESIVKKRIASYKGHLKNIQNLYDLFKPETVELLKEEITAINADLPKRAETLNKNILEILKLTKSAILVEYTDKHVSNMTRRAIDKTFPFHRDKNSVKDALISETFVEFISNLPSDCEKIYFITDNKEDFSDPTDARLPHKDWAKLFSEKIHYSINIAAVLNEIIPESVSKEVVAEIEERSHLFCIDNGKHTFDSENGFWSRSRYGGLTWHYACKKCHMLYDTGEFYD
jgi:hypothetical protein